MKKEYELKCDMCGKDTEPIYYFAGQEFCIACLKKALYRKNGRCECCGNSDDRVYFFSGKFMCASCLEQTASMKGLDYIR